MTDPAPAIDVVGGWTSARLLIRLLYAIDSPWTLTAAGLTHSVTGETCALEMRGTDDAFIDEMQRSESPVRPSLTEANLEGLRDHRSIVRVRAAPTLEASEASRAVLRCGASLVDAGAQGVRCVQSGLAHGAEHWQALARMAQDAEEAGDSHAVGEVLYLALVHPLVLVEGSYRTVGMALLGFPDACVSADVPEPVALDIMEAVHLNTVTGRPPGVGDLVRASPSRPAFVLEREPDPAPSDHPRHNPYGLWRLART